MSGGLVGYLAINNLSFVFSSYQSGKFYLVGRNPKGGLMINERFFQKAMGISVQGRDRLWLATLAQIIRFDNTLDEDQFINATQDACYVPRVAYTTGALDAHDIGITATGDVIFVNTRFNCLATLSENRSFKPVWKPDFIDRIVSEDRCHLNGLAMERGKPRYVTAVSKSNTIDGWRDRRSDGGILIDVASHKIMLEGLSMPHSPRVHDGKLYLLNSGTGELGRVEKDAAGKLAFKPIAFCPGFVRGLAFHGKYAFVGLSKPRYQRFEGLALDARLKAADSEAWCGVQIIDLEDGTCVEWLRIDGAIGELYDVGVLPGVATPMALGFANADVVTLITHEAAIREQ
jgi:uncharacterized protein (TIGR03032 family)